MDSEEKKTSIEFQVFGKPIINLTYIAAHFQVTSSLPLLCWNSIPKSSPRKRRALETSCSTDEHANAKLKACDSGVRINDFIALDDDDHRSSNSNLRDAKM
ncbi:hypothetical protein PGT21_032571 [Puccinia graminis f. sp. tritici]|uniref:Uncharacterized protein n=1 Tax=Puccinia graminis f. sp. tritici TaxID=56615 RepID=A0A5B0PB34_PUCGR|nr:hypothetical protein PGT21_032571 [Puccinia graminis f. sp. tritici]